MNIRQATEDDVLAIVQLNHALFQEDAGQRDAAVNLEWAQAHGRAHFRRLMAREGGLCLLAIEAGEVVGYLAGYVCRSSDYTLVPTAELESMFVQATSRSQGIGTVLAQRFLSWAQENGAVRILVTAYAANEGVVQMAHCADY